MGFQKAIAILCIATHGFCACLNSPYAYGFWMGKLLGYTRNAFSFILFTRGRKQRRRSCKTLRLTQYMQWSIGAWWFSIVIWISAVVFSLSVCMHTINFFMGIIIPVILHTRAHCSLTHSIHSMFLNHDSNNKQGEIGMRQKGKKSSEHRNHDFLGVFAMFWCDYYACEGSHEPLTI